MRALFIALTIASATKVFAEETNCCDPCDPVYGRELECSPPATLYPGRDKCRSFSFYVTGDLLWWCGKEEGLAFVQGNRAPENATANVTGEGKVYAPDSDSNIGFKVGAGARFLDDQWDLFANYTRITFSDESHAQTPSNPNDLIVSHWNAGSPSTNISPPAAFLPINSPVTSAQADWNLDFNSVDFMLGRTGYWGQRFSIQTDFGLKSAWIDQDYSVDFLNVFPAGTQRAELRIKSENWGIGVRAATQALWHLSRYFKVYADLAVAALATHFEVSRTDRMIVTTAPGGLNYNLLLTNLRNDFYSVKGVFETGVGLRFQYQKTESPFAAMLQAGFESQLWPSQSVFYRRLDQVAHGDLSLYGLTLKAKVSF